MISALRPGGLVLIEDYDHVMPLVCVDAYLPEHDRANKAHAGVRALLTEHGLDLEYARALPRILHEAGLRDVGADAYLRRCGEIGDGRSIGCSVNQRA